MEKEYPANFKDNRGREWNIRLTIPVVHRFCAQTGLRFDQFNPMLMDCSQMLDLVYEGTRHHKRVEVEDESKEDFLNSLYGVAFSDAHKAATNAIINFTLRTSPPRQAQKLKEVYEMGLSDLGNGKTSSPSPESQE
jgi:hypothetical protein